MSATDELRKLLDERGVEYEAEDMQTNMQTYWGDWCFMEPLDAKPHTLGAQCELMCIPATPEQAIAATLGDADYERRMDELLCRLTNGKWSKSRSYSVDFMMSCVDEAYEDATLGGGECELVYGENDYGDDGWWCKSCGEWFAASFRHTGRDNIIVPRFCQRCGKAVKR